MVSGKEAPAATPVFERVIYETLTSTATSGVATATLP